MRTRLTPRLSPSIAVALFLVATASTAVATSTGTREPGTSSNDEPWIHIWNLMHYTWYQGDRDTVENPGGWGFDIGLELGFGGEDPGDTFVSTLTAFTLRGVSRDYWDDVVAPGVQLGLLGGVTAGDGLDAFATMQLNWLSEDLILNGTDLFGRNGRFGITIGGGGRWLPIWDTGQRNGFIGLSLLVLYGLLDESVTIGFDISIPVAILAMLHGG